jgi:BNR/Asp-box repeat
MTGDKHMWHHGLLVGIGVLILSACFTGATGVGTSLAPTLRGARFPTSTGMARPATVSGAWVTLSPRAGLPGTVVRISGFLPGGLSAAQAQKTISFNYGHVCWAACPGGLTYAGIPVQWSPTQAGHFTMQFTVPRVPWLGADGPHSLAPGTYTVGVRCIGPAIKGCALQGAQATTTFFLLASPTPGLCQIGPCARLRFTPAAGPPGTVIQVHGWAPLTEIIGQPLGYDLVVQKAGMAIPSPWLGHVQQALNGALSGSFQLPLSIPSLGVVTPGSYTIALQSIYIGVPSPVARFAPELTIMPLGKKGIVQVERITLAPTTFRVTATRSWAALGRVRPLWMQWSAGMFTDQALAADSTNPRRIAYCVPGGIRLSSDGGVTWSVVSTRPVARVAATTSYPLPPGLYGQASPACAALALDPRHPRSVYAAFNAARKSAGIPPTYLVGYVTTDGGQTWRPVSVPTGYTMGEFSNFQVTGRAVQALFGRLRPMPDQAPAVAVEQTTDGGRTWAPARLTCPASGLCVRWGAAPGPFSSMGVPTPQGIAYSTEGGRTWRTPAWPSWVDLKSPGPNALVAVSPTEVALLAGGSAYPFRLSHDGGRTWDVVTLPTLPGSSAGAGPFPGLQMLPDGALLAQTQSAGMPWWLLQPGTTRWCPVSGVALPAWPAALRVIDGRVLWLAGGPFGPGALSLKSVPLSSLRCGPS